MATDRKLNGFSRSRRNPLLACCPIGSLGNPARLSRKAFADICRAKRLDFVKCGSYEKKPVNPGCQSCEIGNQIKAGLLDFYPPPGVELVNLAELMSGREKMKDNLGVTMRKNDGKKTPSPSPSPVKGEEMQMEGPSADSSRDLKIEVDGPALARIIAGQLETNSNLAGTIKPEPAIRPADDLFIEMPLSVAEGLTRGNLYQYWHNPPARTSGIIAACACCGLESKLRACGLCSQCFDAGQNKTGLRLIVALRAMKSAKAADGDGYEDLRQIFEMALAQARDGKGKERHAKPGERFRDQKICEITRRVGMGFPLGQAVKKIEESQRLPGGHGMAEILGAINYLAAAVIVLREDFPKRETA